MQTLSENNKIGPNENSLIQKISQLLIEDEDDSIFSILPLEIHLYILSFLDIPDLIKFSLVSKLSHQLSNDNIPWDAKLITFEILAREEIIYEKKVVSAKQAYKTLNTFFKKFPSNQQQSAPDIFKLMDIDLVNLLCLANNFISEKFSVMPKKIDEVNIEFLRPLLINMLGHNNDPNAQQQARNGANFTHQQCLTIFSLVLANTPAKVSYEDIKLVACYVPEYMSPILNRKILTDKFTISDLIALRFLYPTLQNKIGSIIIHRVTEQPNLLNIILSNPGFKILLSPGQWRFMALISALARSFIKNNDIVTKLNSIHDVQIEELRHLCARLCNYSDDKENEQLVAGDGNFTTQTFLNLFLQVANNHHFSAKLTSTDMQLIAAYVPEVIESLLILPKHTNMFTLNDLVGLKLLYPQYHHLLAQILQNRIIQNIAVASEALENPELSTWLSAGRWRFIALAAPIARSFITNNQINIQLNSINNVQIEELRSLCARLCNYSEDKENEQLVLKGAKFDAQFLIQTLLKVANNHHFSAKLTSTDMQMIAAYVPEVMESLLILPKHTNMFTLNDLVGLKLLYPQYHHLLAQILQNRIIQNIAVASEVLENPELSTWLSAGQWRFIALATPIARPFITNNQIDVQLGSINNVQIEELRSLCARLCNYSEDKENEQLVLKGAKFDAQFLIQVLLKVANNHPLSAKLTSTDMQLIAAYVPEVMRSVLKFTHLTDKFTLDDLAALKLLYPQTHNLLAEILQNRIIQNIVIAEEILQKPELSALLSTGRWRFIALTAPQAHFFISNNKIDVQLNDIHDVQLEELRSLCARLFKYSGDKENEQRALEGVKFDAKFFLQLLLKVLNDEIFSAQITPTDMKIIAAYVPNVMPSLLTIPRLSERFSIADLANLNILYPHLHKQIADIIKVRIIENPELLTTIIANREPIPTLPATHWRLIALTQATVRSVISQNTSISTQLKSIHDVDIEELRSLCANIFKYAGNEENYKLVINGAKFTTEQCLNFVFDVFKNNYLATQLTYKDLITIVTCIPEAMETLLNSTQTTSNLTFDDLITLQHIYPTSKEKIAFLIQDRIVKYAEFATEKMLKEIFANSALINSLTTSHWHSIALQSPKLGALIKDTSILMPSENITQTVTNLSELNLNNNNNAAAPSIKQTLAPAYTSVWSTPAQDKEAPAQKIIDELKKAEKLTLETLKPYLSKEAKLIPAILLSFETHIVNSKLLCEIALFDQEVGEMILQEDSLSARLDKDDLLKIGLSHPSFAQIIKQNKMLLNEFKADRSALKQLTDKAKEVPTTSTQLN